MNEKIDLCTTFDQDASLYEEVRPGYPDALFEDSIKFSEISEGGRILEIGCGTAQATLPFAERDWQTGLARKEVMHTILGQVKRIHN